MHGAQQRLHRLLDGDQRPAARARLGHVRRELGDGALRPAPLPLADPGARQPEGRPEPLERREHLRLGAVRQLPRHLVHERAVALQQVLHADAVQAGALGERAPLVPQRRVALGADERHLAAVAECLDRSISDLSDQLDAVRRTPARPGQEVLDRDLETHRLTARLRALRRFGLDLCLGHMVSADDPEPVYIGRLGLTDSTGRQLLVDWRSPAAEPFFGATHANPMGLASRRRYRWARGRISDYWDEVFTPDGIEGRAALDDQSAFIASLGTNRSARSYTSLKAS